jgi:hypothetical protein
VTVRSAVLGAVVTTAGQTTQLMRIPAGMTAIIKSVVVNNKAGAVAAFYFQVVKSDGSVQVEPINQNIESVAAAVTWSSWMVALQNDVLQVYSDQSGVHVWVSGTLLEGVPSLPPTAGQLPAFPDLQQRELE